MQGAISVAFGLFKRAALPWFLSRASVQQDIRDSQDAIRQQMGQMMAGPMQVEVVTLPNGKGLVKPIMKEL